MANKKTIVFCDASSPVGVVLRAMSKAALIDCVIDACTRMHGEDVFEADALKCLADLCVPVLKERRDLIPAGFEGRAA